MCRSYTSWTTAGVLLPPAAQNCARLCTQEKFHYNFPVVALSSITMRVTGIFLTVGTVGVALPSVVDPSLAPQLFELLGHYSVSPLQSMEALAVSLLLIGGGGGGGGGRLD